MSFPRYPAYKDSGVPWLSTVPAHWSVMPLYSVAMECDEPNDGMREDNLLSLSYGRIVNKDINSNDGLLPESFETYQIVRANDIVFRLTDLQNDKRSLRSALVQQDGIITSAYVAVRPIQANPLFLNHLFRAYDTTKVFYSMGGGLRQSMKFSDMKRLPTLLPPKEEQIAIASFLDRETAKIDALVAEQEKLITLLKEKRQAVISQAVTKGLDPTVPMKDSGVEWLGKVPAHWAMKSLRYLANIETGSSDTADATDDGEFPFFVRSESVERIGTYSFDCEAVLTAGDGAGVGKVFHHFEGKFEAHQRVYVLHGFQELSGRFIYFYLRENFHRVALEGGAKSTVDSLRRPMFTSFPMMVPPASEQKEIIEFVQREEEKFLSLTDKAKEAIKLLQERRSALISAAVTGQIDVCDFGQRAETV